ncbi:hypothetical protein OHA21_09285 [Actinoplanes sp. NBC_00393]|uniref:hypothetical protein n=1 Tax=Actinoplanes sp. NBC_00393 TaxID=2975953 RepID=UPI002E21A123
MRIRAALLFVLTLLGLAVVVSPAAPAWACSCAWNEAEQRKNAEVIVVGRVSEVTDSWVRLDVESVEKGNVDRAAPLRLEVGRSEASCGYGFQEGQRYRVNSRDGHTGLCTGVAKLPLVVATPSAVPPSAIAIEPVAAPAAENDADSPLWPTLGAGFALAAVAAAAFAFRRRRTR